ncbi:uncharacterized protein LOC116616213 [Nematostella vectensis]|uniref:uncharacterized protein LOC116616213 n=1 Tax=Nematostella vectensis TaxID=45351 RepID=UPI002076FA43|nr:uncharacterized protein LOC116616213 [Nematostella vectensis]
MASSSSYVSNSDFMEEVRKCDCLYNRYHPEYKQKEKKAECWAEIGEKFNISASDAEKRFKNIRTSYGRFLKRIRGRSLTVGSFPIPEHFYGLDWLNFYISPRHRMTKLQQVQNNGDAPSSNDGDDDTIHEHKEDKQEATTATTKNNTGTRQEHLQSRPSQEKSRNVNQKPLNKRLDDEVDRALFKTAASICENFKEMERKRPHEDYEEDGLFLRSLIPRMKKLSPQSKAALRIKIEQAFYEAEFSQPSTHVPIVVHVNEPQINQEF